MTPRLQAWFDALDEGIGQLEQAARAKNAQLAEQRERHEKLTQQYWTAGRELAVARRAADDYERMQQEADAQRQALKSVRERLEGVLIKTKALSAELRA